MRRRLRILGALLAGGLTASACGATNGQASGTPPSINASGVGGSVTIANESGSTWTCGFNPFNGSVSMLSIGFEYEPLMFVNVLQNDAVTPWLATSYAWSNDNKSLTFTIRSGVKWSDGQPFSANDVLFTMNMLKKNPAMDVNSLWSVLRSVALDGSDKVVFNFNTSATTYFYYVADQLSVVPQHIWSKVAKPLTWNDSSPVGTGPYLVSKCTPENVTYTANKNYWQPGLPKVQTVNYPAFSQNTTANEELAEGDAQWGGQYIPDIQGYYLSKSTSFHDWFPPTTNVCLFPNLTDKLLSLPVREAISMAIDRQKVSQLGETGYEPPANQDGIVSPTFSSWASSTDASKFSYNPAAAETLLENAGYKKVNGVFQSPSGQPLSFKVINIGDYSDWVADLTVVTDDLAQIGIKLQVENLSSTTYDADVFDGDFQLAYDGENGGPSPYYEIRQWLYGPNSAPVGKTASTNWERFMPATVGADSTAVDALLNKYPTVVGLAAQEGVVAQLENYMVKDVPVIPVVESVDWYEYDSTNLSGWPTATDAYAQPSPYVQPDLEVVLLHLRWTK